MRIGFGFSSVTFRPSRVFHSRVFGRPSVDMDEQSSWKLPAFLSNIENVVTNSSCWQCLCTLLFRYFVCYAVITVHAVEIFHCTIRFTNPITKEVPYETFSISFHFHKLSPKHFCFDAAVFRLSIKGYCKTRPRRSFCHCLSFIANNITEC